MTVSGRNGTGKSLLLEGLHALWSTRSDLAFARGPWADDIVFDVEVSLTTDELAAVEAWARDRSINTQNRAGLRLRVQVPRNGGENREIDSYVVGILRDHSFQLEHRFAVVDFLPSHRQLAVNAARPNVDLALLDQQAIENERRQFYDNYTLRQTGTPLTLPNVENYLLTLDYQSYLASRQGLTIEDEYDAVAMPFEQATSKVLEKPQYDDDLGAVITVRLPSGSTHRIAQLSHGEKELLAMMYFVRRLSASGGVLLLDEPEQHLHPSLQIALVETLKQLADRAQIFIVTHAASLITAAPQTAVVQLEPPIDRATNQVQRIHDTKSRLALISVLGVAPADLHQYDAVLILEGPTDRDILAAIFPAQMGRCETIVASGKRNALQMTENLLAAGFEMPLLCTVDRDILAAAPIVHPALANHVFTWSRRAIESVLLDPALIAAVLATNVPAPTSAEVAHWLNEFADAGKEEVIQVKLEEELTRRFPAPERVTTVGRVESLRRYHQAYERISTQRAAAVDETASDVRAEVEAVWAAEALALADPKAVIGQLHSRSQLFRTKDHFRNALAVRLRDDRSLMPTELVNFESRLREILATSTGRPSA